MPHDPQSVGFIDMDNNYQTGEKSGNIRNMLKMYLYFEDVTTKLFGYFGNFPVSGKGIQLTSVR